MQLRKFIYSATLGLGVTLSAMPVAAADLVVVVSSKSSVSNLSADQVGQIFLAKSSSFPNGDAATPVDQSGGSVRDDFYDKVTGKDQSQLKAYWSQLMFSGKAKPPKAVADSAEVKKLVAGNPNAIGYISKSAVDSSVKVVLAP